MTPAEILKSQMKKSWGRFSDDELYRVFCLLIEQIETLEKQNKSLKQEIQILQEKTVSPMESEIKEIELLKTNAKRDAIKIIQETEKISKVMIEQAISDVETIMEETTQFEQQQLQIKEELIDFLNSKIDDIRNCFGKS
ncbi:MAG: DivIVA domain-containing protein [Turicibacter sp.]|nr:DivIVA domain-containing protein [Turicibacter sp.]MBQ1785712.1 DivIVA domain-containing protein [Turicibacter sp.]